MKNTPKAFELFECMKNEEPVYIKGSLLKQIYPEDTFTPEALYAVNDAVNDAVNLTFCEGDSFIDTIEDIEFDNVFMIK